MLCKNQCKYIYTFAINFNKTRMRPVKLMVMIHLCTLILIYHNFFGFSGINLDRLNYSTCGISYSLETFFATFFFTVSICIHVHLNPGMFVISQQCHDGLKHHCKAEAWLQRLARHKATDSDVRSHVSCSVFYRYYFSADI